MVHWRQNRRFGEGLRFGLLYLLILSYEPHVLITMPSIIAPCIEHVFLARNSMWCGGQWFFVQVAVKIYDSCGGSTYIIPLCVDLGRRRNRHHTMGPVFAEILASHDQPKTRRGFPACYRNTFFGRPCVFDTKSAENSGTAEPRISALPRSKDEKSSDCRDVLQAQHLFFNRMTRVEASKEPQYEQRPYTPSKCPTIMVDDIFRVTSQTE